MTQKRKQKGDSALEAAMPEVLKKNSTDRGSYNQPDLKMKKNEDSEDTALNRNFSSFMKQFRERFDGE